MPGSFRLRRNRLIFREIDSPRDLLLLLRVFSMAALVPLLMQLPLPRLLAWLTPASERELDSVRSRKVLVFVRAYMRLFRRRSGHRVP